MDSVPPPATLPTNAAALPVNDLAAAYQLRRVWAAQISIVWNLFLAAAFIASHAAWWLYEHLESYRLPHTVVGPIYVAIFFIAYLIFNYPLELYFGYLEERQFGLAKHGIRAWTRDWMIGSLHHGLQFVIGSSLLLLIQSRAPHAWLLWAALLLAGLLLGSSYFAASLLPRGLFHWERADSAVQQRLEQLAGTALPPIVIYNAAQLRDYSGGLVGLGDRQVLLMSRSTLTSASDEMIRFVLLHEVGHRRHHHVLLATLSAWAWLVLGLCLGNIVMQRFSPQSMGLPPAMAWMALCLSVWMAIGEPVLAYLGRRLEYQADRFFLRSGGTLATMRAALSELADRNLARTEGLRRRQTIFHPLPSIWNRIHAATVFQARQLKG
jgi:Zn-dependent protease with chaperone function